MLMSFSDYLTKQPRIARTTIRNYTVDVAHFLRWWQTYCGKRSPLDTVTGENIASYISVLPLSTASKQRRLSALRKFFSFLKMQGSIVRSPFDQAVAAREETDHWNIKDFANYLYVYNASELTIKYYTLDVKHFVRWVQRNNLAAINHQALAAYKTQLAQDYTTATINRKHAAINKYLSWIGNK